MTLIMAGKMANEFPNEFEVSCSEEDDAGWDEVIFDNTNQDDFSEAISSKRHAICTTFNPLPVERCNDLLGQPLGCESSHANDENSTEVEGKSSQKPIQRMALNDHKAGMEGLDKEKINKIIFDASKGSKYYENEKKKEKRVKEKIQSLRTLMQTFTEADFENARMEAKKFVKNTKKERDFSRIIVHVDMDAFYAAVETRDNPSLKDIPMAVGSNHMLSTSNYAARKYGVRAAMPGFIAKKLCPNLTIVPLNFAKYREVSNQVRKVISEYDPHFCGMGLDEAYLDLTDYIKGISCTATCEPFIVESDCYERQQLIEKTVQELREKIFAQTQLTASAGIACNVMLAKVCSDMNKPNGQYYLPPKKDTIMNFIANLPIRKVSGIGRVSEQILNEFGITKCGDLYEKKELLYLMFSEISFQHFIRISLGISSTFLDNESERKSMSAETTFQEISDPEKLLQICKDLCNGLADDMQKENLAGRSITVKFKLVNFEIKTRTKTILDYVNTSNEIYDVAKEIIKNQTLACKPKRLKLRLLGVRVSDFGEKQKQFQNKLDSFLSKTIQMEADESISAKCNTNANSLVERKRHHDGSSCMPLDDSNNNLICPVCQGPQKASEINAHIDSCLNKQTIREILSEDCKDDLKGNRKAQEKEGQSSRKRKAINDLVVNKATKKKTLQSFWGNR